MIKNGAASNQLTDVGRGEGECVEGDNESVDV
jgi:hypothetical protein